MSQLLSLTPAGPVIHGEAPLREPPTPRIPPNQGQGDSRKRIVPGVKSPEAPSATTWEGGALLTLDQWLESRPPGGGVLLQPTDDPYRLADALEGLALVAIDIHRINDGRGYSLAKIIRSRMGFKGALRAVGAVTADQVFALASVGFDQFALRADQDGEAALSALSTFSLSYHAGLAAAPDTVRRAAAAQAEARLALLRRPIAVAGAAS